MYFITKRVKDPEALDAVESLQHFIDKTTEDIEADDEGVIRIHGAQTVISRYPDGSTHILRQGEMEDRLLHVNGNRVTGEEEHMHGRYSRVRRRNLGSFVTSMEAELRTTEFYAS